LRLLVDGLDFTDPYRRHARAAAGCSFALLVLLTVGVATGATDPLDISVRDRFRPHFMWGSDQQRAAHVVSALGPPHMLLLLTVGSLGVALWRLNVWPVVQAALAVAATGALTLAVKVMVDRADPGGAHTSLGGSFPSGHSAMLMIATSTGAMLVSCPTRWWQRAGVALLWSALSIGLLYDGVHWLSDIVGGALAAGVVLGVVAALLGPTGGRPHVIQRPARGGPTPIPQSRDRDPGKIS
jgi:membrane-associated phospholipid phosphatase